MKNQNQMKTLMKIMWKTHTKQTFGSRTYYNTVLESNFSKYLNTTLKNIIVKTLTKHALYI